MDAFRAQASTSTRLPIGVDPSTPAGLSRAYALGAGECLQAAKKLDEGMSDLTGEYIVTFHAIELGLKAFLIKHGMDAGKLRRRPFGHDLVRLYDEAKRHGLALSDDDAETIAWINEWHCDGVRIRYEFTAERTLPMCVTLFPLAEAMINASK
jgi:HEPN domain-containing protein